MAQFENSSFYIWLHYFYTLNSTNNYAMQFIDDGMAQHGNVIWAKHQTAGKGQRGKKWEDNIDNLKMSLIIQPEINPEHQFILSMLTANCIVNYVKSELPSSSIVSIKWPNDIYINDKKTCGILIENIFRGMKWAYSVIGIGLNINQTQFPESLNKATSLKNETDKSFNFIDIIYNLRAGILNTLNHPLQLKGILSEYNAALYKKGKSVNFRNLETGKQFEAFVVEVTTSGELLLLTPNGIQSFAFGSLEWILK